MKKYFLLTIFVTGFSMNLFASGNALENVEPNEALASVAPIAEDQIPLKITESEKTFNASSSTQRVIFSLGIVVILAGVGYFTVKRYSHRSIPGKSNMQIKILSQHYLGPKKSLAIIRVAGESILVGITDHNISMIKSLALLDEELPQVLPKDFSETMTEQNDKTDVDEFTFEGIRSTVAGKIKSMRNIQ